MKKSSVGKHPLLLGLLTGVLLSAAYRLPGWWPVSFVALVPLLYGIFHASNAKSHASAHQVRTVFLAGTIAGTCIMGTAMVWLFSASALPAAFGVTSSVFTISFIGLSWLLASIVTGAAVGFWALIVRSLKPHHFFDLVAIAALWVGGEYARMYFYNALTFNPSVSNPGFFSVGFIAYPFMDSDSWRQFVAFGGILFLGFIIAFVNVLFYRFLLIRDKRRKTISISSLALILLVISFLPIISFRESLFPSHTTTSLKIAVISDNTPELGPGVDASSYQKETYQLVSSAVSHGSDVVLLPEDTRFFLFGSQELFSSLGAANTVLIDSAPIISNGIVFVESLAETKEGSAAIRDKSIFTPQGEYIPSLFEIFLEAIGAKKDLQSFNNSRNFTQATSDGSAADFDGIHASLLFCLEVMAPNFGKQLVDEQGSQLLLVPSSDAAFDHSSALEQDVLRWNQAQAVSAGVPLVQSADMAPGFILDKYGRVISEIGKNGIPGFAVVTIPL